MIFILVYMELYINYWEIFKHFLIIKMLLTFQHVPFIFISLAIKVLLLKILIWVYVFITLFMVGQ